MDSRASEEVELVTVDRFVDANGISRLDALKLDVEGAEFKVLLGSRRVLDAFRPAIVFEVSAASLAANGDSPGDLDAFLAELGYCIFRIREDDAELEMMERLPPDASENFVALPRGTLLRERDPRG